MAGALAGGLVGVLTADYGYETALDVSNAAALQQALSDMAIGMSTALYTTLIGLVCSLIIKVQLVNLEVALNE